MPEKFIFYVLGLPREMLFTYALRAICPHIPAAADRRTFVCRVLPVCPPL